MIWSVLVFATNSVSPALLKARPFAPNGGTPFGFSRSLAAHWVGVPPYGPVLQMIPWNESEMYTLPSLSNVRTFGPGLGLLGTLGVRSGIVVNTSDSPVCGFTLTTLPLPKSITSSLPVLGWNARSSRNAEESSTSTARFSSPWRLKTNSRPMPVPRPVSNVVT